MTQTINTDIEAPEVRKHHPYSPSTLQNREWCPCYEGRQSEVEHERTTAGTRAHGVVETGEDDHRLSDDDAVAAAECLDFVARHQTLMEEEARRALEAEREKSLLEHMVQPHPLEFKVTELKEVKLAVDDVKYPDADCTTSGYVDRVLLNWNNTKAKMFDWKFGKWPVEGAANNLQGIAYVLGLFRMFPTLETIEFYFKQPHLELTSEATFTRSQVPELYLRVQTVVARAREAKARGDFSMARPAVPVCNFCANLGRCTPVCEFACKVSRKFHPIEIPENITPSLINSPEQTALGLRLAAVLKIWCDAFRTQVTDRVIRGDAPLPSGQKIQSMQKRELVDMAKLRTAALAYLTEAEFSTTLACTFGDVEKLISEKSPRGHKKETVEEFQKALLTVGAVKLGDKFSFLRAIPVKE